jgi:hypothetical protein
LTLLRLEFVRGPVLVTDLGVVEEKRTRVDIASTAVASATGVSEVGPGPAETVELIEANFDWAGRVIVNRLVDLHHYTVTTR